MIITASAAALLLLAADAGQAAPATQAAPPAADLTRNLNSGPPRPAEYLAPPPEAEAEAPPRPTTRATTPPASASAAPPASAPARPATTAPTTAPTSAAPVATTRPPVTAPAAPAATPRPSTAAAPSNPPARPAPTTAPTPSAPAATTRPPAAAPAAPASSAAARPAAPPPPGVTVLDAVALEDLPFSVDLPTGFEIVTGRPGPDFRIYTIRRGERSFVMVYTGPASQFPIYSGDLVEAGGRASVITTEDGQRHALEHLFQRPNAPREVHIWTMSLDGADRALAERIAQSVDVR